MTMPSDPITVMGQGAAELHELFLSNIKAGFTRKEALYLTGKYLQAVVMANAAGTDSSEE
jgi:hypothetical protein